MGKHNLIVNQFLERKEIFADLINGTVFEGQQVLQPEKLVLKSTNSGVLQKQSDDRLAALERRGDIRMLADMGTYSVILANETQQKVHYGMPVRSMLYDALEYTRQLQELKKQHKEAGNKLQNDEFLSGITLQDRLQPVITTVLYCGEEWDGPQCLYDLLDMDETDRNTPILKEYLSNYQINLIQPDKMEHLENFHTCLQQIFHMVKYKKDAKKLKKYVQDHQEEIEHMDRLAATAAFELMGESKAARAIWEKADGKEEEEVGSAWQEILQEREDIGVEKGMEAFGRMIDGLINEGRSHLIPALSKDEALRKELYSKYCEENSLYDKIK